jgi:PKD repeat protein
MTDRQRLFVSAPRRRRLFALLTIGFVVPLSVLVVHAQTGSFAEDTFSRVQTGGWGTAEVGGSYTHFGTAADYAVDGAVGTMTLPVANSSRGTTLESVSAADVSVTARVRAAKPATGTGQYFYLVARRQLGSNSEYRAQVRVTPDGNVHIAAARVTSGSSSLVGTWATVAGLSYSANTWLWVRAEFEGTIPTTIRSRVWAMGQPEPTTWQFTATDSTAALQTAGGVGLRTYLGSNATNAPLVVGFDDLLVGAPGDGSVPPPQADFNHAQQPDSLKVRFADTTTGGPTSWSWDFGDGSTTTSRNAAHTYAEPGSYLVSLTARSAAGSTTEKRPIDVAPVDAPPGQPAGLSGVAGDGQVSLSWSAVNESDVVGYNVYRDGVPSAPTLTLTGAGDISTCDTTGRFATADLLDGVQGWIYTVGDNDQGGGTAQEFSECYHPAWGRHWARTWPAAGNHEYHTTGAAGYFGYFGEFAGDPHKGYYAFELGSWLVVVLNSECSHIGGCAEGSPQEVWLRQLLAVRSNTCALAIWHRPLFTSSPAHAPSTNMRPLFTALHDAGAELLLVGHNHVYERFAPQDELGNADPLGIRQISVGTGGFGHHSFGTPAPNSEVRNADTFGVLKLTLGPASYDWQFLPIAGRTFTDSGHTACHDTEGPLGVAPRLNQSPLSDTSYVDSAAINGAKHRYVVTAVDSAGNESVPSAAVRATASGPPPPPVADFTFNQQTGSRTVDFRDTSGGSPTAWSWDFGDGTSSTQQNPSKTYAAAGDHSVTLSVSNAGGSDSVTKTVSVTEPPSVTTHALDAFGRTVNNGWGSADVGGSYSLEGSTSNFSVGDGTGNLVLPTNGATRASLLGGVSVRDVDVIFRVRTDKLAVGGAQYVYAVVRRNGGNAYRPKIILNPNGSVAVHAGLVVNNSESSIAPSVVVPGLTHTANGFIWVRAQVSGASPTTIRVRAWADGQPEPTAWHFSATNSNSVVQVAGAVGLRAYMSSNNAPVTFRFDDFSVTTP